MQDKIYVQVAVNLPFKSLFDYSVPEQFKSLIKVGKRVWIPFRNRVISGCIVKISPVTKIPRVKEIKDIIDPEPFFSPDILELTKWIAVYYFCSWGEAIEAAIPAPFKKGNISLRVRKKQNIWLMHNADLQKEKKNVLTLHQSKAFAKIIPYIKTEKFKVFLLHGITASGKTEVYFSAIEAVLKQNKTAIVFVPEIAITPQMVEWFILRFGRETIAVMHSRLSKGEKFIEWQRIKEGKVQIVIGARSAIFCPLKNLGLIVVDEEHETSYKQEETPRYNLVDTAIQRARICNALLILGSATPSLDSFYRAQHKQFELIELSERVYKRNLPLVQIVNKLRQKGTKQVIFSKFLENSIKRCLQNKEQAMLFLNRRGFSTFVYCLKCGHTLKCKNCNVSLVYHFGGKYLICHHCNYHIPLPSFCPECNSKHLHYSGIGTEHVENKLRELFPKAVIGRMDSDVLRKKGAYFKIFTDFKSGKTDILVGTQILAKGFDFPNVTLVGVISADVNLNIPDFRASERTFALLTQVAGRAGRGKVPGRVVIQTYTPEHYAIRFALTHNYNKFYNQEIFFRKQLNLPPYTHMALIVFRSENEEITEKSCRVFSEILRKENKLKSLEIMGHFPLPLSKLRGYFRWGIIIKNKDVFVINNLLRKCLSLWKRHKQVKITFDIDPLTVI